MRHRQFFRTIQRLALTATVAAHILSAAGPPAPYLVLWLKTSPGDLRIQSLAAKPTAPLSPNAPGLLLTLEPGSWKVGNATAAQEAVRTLARHARLAGWRWGLDLALPDVKIPADVRAAEAATVEDLWPGLGEILRDAKETDLVTIAFSSREGFDPKVRAYLLRKVAAGARAATSHARLVLAAGPLATGAHLPADVRGLLSEENTAYVDFVGVTPLARPAPGEVRVAVDEMAFGKPALVDLGATMATPAALLAAGARLAAENAPFVVTSPPWSPSQDAILERFARLIDGDFGPDSEILQVMRQLVSVLIQCAVRQ